MVSSHNKKLALFFKTAVLIAAYVFLISKFWGLEHKEVAHLLDKAAGEYLFLLVAVLSMPLNIIAEVWHWHYSLKACGRCSFFMAFRSALGGLIPGIISPARIGEWPGRAMFFDAGKRRGVVTVAAYAGIIKSSSLLLFGGLSLFFLWFYFNLPGVLSSFILPVTVLIIIALTVFLFSRRAMQFTLGRFFLKSSYNSGFKTFEWLNLSYRLNSFLIASFRNTIFYVQFWCLLNFVGFEPGFELALMIPVYYMALTFIPVFTIAEPGMRGSLAILLFSGVVESSTMVGVLGVMLWFINNLPALIIGSVFWVKRH